MNKQLLLSFISKYNLGGEIESVVWDASGDSLKTRFISDDDSLLGMVELTNKKLSNEITHATIPVHRTSNLIKLLNVLADNVDIELKQVGDKPISLKIEDSKTNIKYALADLGIIKKAPPLKFMPDNFGVVMKIDPAFAELYIKAKSALPNVEAFTLVATDDGARIVLGESTDDINIDKVTFAVETSKCESMPNLLFNANLFKEVLSVNKNQSSTFRVSVEGLAILEFESDEYKSTYYFVSTEDE